MPPPAETRARVVLLGASNLRRGLPAALRCARRHLGAPLDVLVAAGAGRSYGARSTVLGRALPGILECGLWPALARAEPRPTRALLADVGNDVVYGARPQQILGWVDACLERLEAAGASTVLLLYPPQNAHRLPPWLFQLVGRALYPFRRLDRARILDDVAAVDAGLRELAARRGVRTVELRPEWYGLDPVHLRARGRDAAWGVACAAWPALDAGAPAGVPPSDDPGHLRMLTTVPERRWLAGFEQRGAQPARTLADGSRVSLY